MNPVGPQAGRIDELWHLFLAVGGAVVGLVILFELIVVSKAARRRKRALDADPLEYDLAQERRMIRVISGLTVATVTILLVLLAASVRTGAALSNLDTYNAVAVKITGHQWWWQIEYDDGLPSDHVVTANELHVPVGKTVVIELTSTDVIHSLWIPAVHGKQDLIPGRTNRILIRVDAPGRHRGQCAEFCGLEHAEMGIELVAEPPDKFDAWLSAQRAIAEEPKDDITERGKQVFLSSTCRACHTINGTEAGGALGPDLTHFASRRTLAAATLVNEPETLATWIRNPQHDKPGVRMPLNDLTDDDLAALVAYLESLR